MGHLKVKVAETPYGNADSPIHGSIFVKPEISEMSGGELLDLLEHAKSNPSAYYMQSQDGNLHKEFSPLLKDIPGSLPFADPVFRDEPEAVNLWIGSSGTTSRLHNGM
ncbi:hypothetical protein AWJ20_2716 [Sugiyamaella lignohabitans]|uniref:Cupin-like domain-containing protein n=1 Tax=Sugiyamaella lignohabitans TaxID=796027 RepID=A0A167FC25_9ASCO|nr:uncharacterized protein AWJ20_2716 [Sugiyamaella lignohabitans]ANB15096.1 hypothetical protein AWJ20_2716 [Sugiyamaella lignohabitans]